VDDEDGGDDEPSLGSIEPLEPEPGETYVWCGKVYKVNDEDRAAVYSQST
jgi:hypothetical protein